MIERIRLDDANEKYVVKIGSGEVVVIMSLNGVIKIINPNNETEVKATLSQYETWTFSSSGNSYDLSEYAVQATESTGADFLIVRYYR